MNLPQRLLALDEALARADLPHAFGGAIALAYWTEEPRGTRDLDVNVFVPVADAAVVLRALPRGVAVAESDEAALARDGQARLWWDDTPVALFLDYDPIHHAAAEHRQAVPFQGRTIPVLGPVELGVFKALFDRTKDWADIEAMRDAQTLDLAHLRLLLVGMIGEDDPRIARVDALRAHPDE